MMVELYQVRHLCRVLVLAPLTDETALLMS
jgi:hypothetical protein